MTDNLSTSNQETPPSTPDHDQASQSSQSAPIVQQVNQQIPTPPQILAQLMLAQRGGVPNLGQQVLMAGAAALQLQQSWQGPYPPPDAVERYEKILPGTFDRLIKMAEQLQQAQIDEAKEIRLMTHADQKRGNYLGFVTTIVAMAGGILCLHLGSGWLGACFLSVPVMAVAKALIEPSKQSTPMQAIETPQVANSPDLSPKNMGGNAE